MRAQERRAGFLDINTVAILFLFIISLMLMQYLQVNIFAIGVILLTFGIMLFVLNVIEQRTKIELTGEEKTLYLIMLFGIEFILYHMTMIGGIGVASISGIVLFDALFSFLVYSLLAGIVILVLFAYLNKEKIQKQLKERFKF